jgi:hypothetical protein
MTNVNDEYYGSAEQCFWEGPCSDPACGYCAKRKAPKLTPHQERLYMLALIARMDDAREALEGGK